MDFFNLTLALALNFILPRHRASLTRAGGRLLRLAVANRVHRRLGSRELLTIKGRRASVWRRWRVLPAWDVGWVVDVGVGRLCELRGASLLHALSQGHSLARVERALHLALLAHFAPHAIGAVLRATVVAPFALGAGWLLDISQRSGCTREHSPDGRLSPAGPAPIARTTRHPASHRRPMLFAAPPARAFCPASSRAVPRPSVLLM